jgi:hypothetical protein
VEQQQVAENILVLLQDLNRKNERSKAMPSLGGFLNHQQVWNGPDFRSRREVPVLSHHGMGC